MEGKAWSCTFRQVEEGSLGGAGRLVQLARPSLLSLQPVQELSLQFCHSFDPYKVN